MARHIVRVACLIKADIPKRFTRVPEVYEHEAAFCHASPHKIEFSLESRLSPLHDPLEDEEASVSFFNEPRRRDMTRHHFRTVAKRIPIAHQPVPLGQHLAAPVGGRRMERCATVDERASLAQALHSLSS